MTAADEVRALEQADRLEEAATLASAQGLHADASRLWERACRYDLASVAALAAKDAARAFELAARAGGGAIETDAISELVKSPELATRMADKLADMGRPVSAGRLRLALGDAAGAGADFERGAAWLEAAAAHERAGDPRQAARCLETAIDSDAGSQRARLELGMLLMRHARYDAALRALQHIPKNAPERARALPQLRRALDALGLTEAVHEIDREIEQSERTSAPPESNRSDSLPNLGGPSAAILFGRYRVLEQVARTPTARVYHAVDQVTQEEVAVKLFSAATLRDAGRDALKHFEREAVVLGQLRHPAIVPLRAFVPDGPAVVLAWMSGGSLADALAKATLSPARAVEIACAVLGALGEAHRRGILHRDIKPANVLFDGAGAAHLADFGTAHVSDAAATVTSGVIGTLAYMAPEQRSGKPANAASDIYGVGALLWHALTGAPVGAALPFLSPELDQRHRKILDRLLAPESERPENALEAAELLRSIAWPRTEPPPRSSRPPAKVASATHDARLEPIAPGLFRDRLLGRTVRALEATGPTLERALAFARADHPALANVLVYRQQEGLLLIEAIQGASLSRSLADWERVWLAGALEALARAGGFHGAVDRSHVCERHGELVLGFPLAPVSSSLEADLAGLAALSA